MQRQLKKLTRQKVSEEQAGLREKLARLMVGYHGLQVALQGYRQALGSLRPFWPLVTPFLLWQGRRAYHKELRKQRREYARQEARQQARRPRRGRE